MRIALVNDVVTAVEAMRRVVLSTREHRLAWVAHDGAAELHVASEILALDKTGPRLRNIVAQRRRVHG